jgi:hypothetical protein
VAGLLLVAALVLERPSLVPAAALLVGGLYGAQLAIAGEPLDVLAPVVAAGLLLAVELAYWSIEERVRWEGDPGDGARRAALVALAGAGAFLVAALLLVLVDAVRARGLALDLVGAAAAAAVLLTVLAVGRAQSSSGS